MISNIKTCGNYECLKWLFTKLNEEDNRQGHRVASRLIHRYNKEFNAISRSNLDDKMKDKFLIRLKHEYKKSIFEDMNIKSLCHDDKRDLNNFVVTKWRRWREGK